MSPGTPLPPPPFAPDLATILARLDPRSLAGCLDPLPLGPPPCGEGERPAAVLLGLRPGAEGPELLLVRRADHLDEHAGQIALPGGRMDAGDGHPGATALREAAEETGLDPGRVTLLGCLGQVPVPVSRHRVQPVAAWLERGIRVGKASPETAAVWFSPLARLLAAARPVERRGRRAWDFHLPGARVWGMTALVVEELFRRLGHLTREPGLVKGADNP